MYTIFAAQASAQLICCAERPSNGGNIDRCAPTGQRLSVTQGLQQIEPNSHVGIGTARFKTDHIAFADQGCQITGDAPLTVAVCSNQHMGQPWVQRQ